MRKALIVAELRDIEEMYIRDEITYSKKVELINEKAEIYHEGKIREYAKYLVKFIDPQKIYAVDYTIKQDGTKVNEPSYLKGEDLTEPQIVRLLQTGLL